ncbi:arginine/serine-rich coiled-coil protein 2-like [Hydra vulgaris]|uniref:Arginine/serine-rich coiled-coil protein 2-like n=1 Tax=Hydra vulgaris TaxID=6087 RepID=A0ABM4B977_HYDVU
MHTENELSIVKNHLIEISGNFKNYIKEKRLNFISKLDKTNNFFLTSLNVECKSEQYVSNTKIRKRTDRYERRKRSDRYERRKRTDRYERRKRSDRYERRKRSDRYERRKRSDRYERRKRTDRYERRKRSDRYERRKLSDRYERRKQRESGEKSDTPVMPRVYKRKSESPHVSENILKIAVAEVENVISLGEAAYSAGISKSALHRKGNNIGPERKVGSGRKATKMPAKEIKRLKKSIDQKDGNSQRGLAKRYHVSQPFVPKEHNPANVPELRPIEDFWSELKRSVYNKNWQAENLGKLKKRTEFSIKKIDIERVHRLAAATFTRVDTVHRHGLKNL